MFRKNFSAVLLVLSVAYVTPFFISSANASGVSIFEEFRHSYGPSSANFFADISASLSSEGSIFDAHSNNEVRPSEHQIRVQKITPKLLAIKPCVPPSENISFSDINSFIDERNTAITSFIGSIIDVHKLKSELTLAAKLPQLKPGQPKPIPSDEQTEAADLLKKSIFDQSQKGAISKHFCSTRTSIELHRKKLEQKVLKIRKIKNQSINLNLNTINNSQLLDLIKEYSEELTVCSLGNNVVYEKLNDLKSATLWPQFKDFSSFHTNMKAFNGFEAFYNEIVAFNNMVTAYNNEIKAIQTDARIKVKSIILKAKEMEPRLDKIYQEKYRSIFLEESLIKNTIGGFPSLFPSNTLFSSPTPPRFTVGQFVDLIQGFGLLGLLTVNEKGEPDDEKGEIFILPAKSDSLSQIVYLFDTWKRGRYAGDFSFKGRDSSIVSSSPYEPSEKMFENWFSPSPLVRATLNLEKLDNSEEMMTAKEFSLRYKKLLQEKAEAEAEAEAELQAFAQNEETKKNQELIDNMYKELMEKYPSDSYIASLLTFESEVLRTEAPIFFFAVRKKK